MLFISLLITATFLLWLIFKNNGAKKLCNIPWYFHAISLDIGKKKGKTYFYKNIAGTPDAVFKHILLPIYIVCELKGRTLFNKQIKKYEFGQISLYLGIIKAKHIGFVSGKLIFKNQNIAIKYKKSTFKDIVNKKEKALKILNKFQ